MKLLILFALLFTLPACTLQSNTSANGTSTATKSVQLNWTAGTGSISGYYVEQSTAGGAYSVVQTVIAPNVSATITGLSTGKTYSFRVRAYNTTASSSYTSVVSVSL